MAMVVRLDRRMTTGRIRKPRRVAARVPSPSTGWSWVHSLSYSLQGRGCEGPDEAERPPAPHPPTSGLVEGRDDGKADRCRGMAGPLMGKVSRYTVIRKIADGGMAEIYLGTQHGAVGFERPIVI